MSDQNSGNYGADNITVLEGLEAVRKRPAMYIGDIGPKGLHHLVYEVVDNSIDEALAGHCRNIYVSILEDNSIRVLDDGRGIPTGMHQKEKKSALEVVMTVLHAGGKFDKDTYKVSGGLHGVGVSCVNALSKHLKVRVFREGKIFQQEYQIGKPLYDVKVVGESEQRGTEVTFTPDDTIFQATEYQFETLQNRLRELAYLNKGIRLVLTDERNKDEEGNFHSETFFSEGGLKEFVAYIDGTREKLIPEPVYCESDKYGIPVEIALQYNTGYSENLHSYVNNINTIEGGTHVAGFRRALTRTLKSYAEKQKLL
ncbi:MAG: DNA topoisomerase IV subunit B, partial [Sphingomonadales bacterium]|nr:DNA topoisomerase IV subunit B [Sphingomonadales bacterium]